MRSRAIVLTGVLISSSLVSAVTPVVAKGFDTTGSETTQTERSIVDRKARALKVRVKQTAGVLRIRVTWLPTRDRAKDHNRYHVRVMTTRDTNKTVVANISRRKVAVSPTTYRINLTARDRATIRRADRAVVAVSQLHDGADADRRYERSFAAIKDLRTAQPAPATPTARDCRRVKIGPKADLHDCNLTGVKLERTDLAQVNLSGAILTGAHLHRSRLVEANLARVDLTKADLNSADLRATYGDEIHAPYARLASANLGASVQYAPNYQNASFRGASLDHVAMNDGNFDQVDFSLGDLSYGNFLGSSRKGANFEGANLRYVVW